MFQEEIQYGMDQKTKEAHAQKIDALVGRLDSILPKVRQAKDDVESLWKAYTVSIGLKHIKSRVNA